MSLIMQMHFLGADRSAVKALAERAAKQFGVRLSLQGDCTVELTAAHDALTDDADWDVAHWSMKPETLPELEREVRILHQLSATDIELTALWAGESVTEQIALSIDEMATVIRSGQIGTRSQYRITRQAGSEGNPQ